MRTVFNKVIKLPEGFDYRTTICVIPGYEFCPDILIACHPEWHPVVINMTTGEFSEIVDQD